MTKALLVLLALSAFACSKEESKPEQPPVVESPKPVDPKPVEPSVPAVCKAEGMAFGCEAQLGQEENVGCNGKTFYLKSFADVEAFAKAHKRYLVIGMKDGSVKTAGDHAFARNCWELK